MPVQDFMSSLEGTILVASPKSQNYKRSVFYICSDDNNGSMALEINKPAKMDSSSVMNQLGIKGSPELPILVGGPKETGRGFVLHSDDFQHSTTISMNDGIALTSTLDVLEEIAGGKGPEKAIFCLGYTEWYPGELLEEFKKNEFLVCPYNQKILFGSDNMHKWQEALTLSGIDDLKSFSDLSSSTH